MSWVKGCLPLPHKASFSVVLVPLSPATPALPTSAFPGIAIWGLTLLGSDCCNPTYCIFYRRGTRKWSYPASTSTIPTVTSGSMNISLHPGSVCPTISQPWQLCGLGTRRGTPWSSFARYCFLGRVGLVPSKGGGAGMPCTRRQPCMPWWRCAPCASSVCVRSRRHPSSVLSPYINFLRL